MSKYIFLGCAWILSCQSQAQDWSSQAVIPEDGRRNILQLPEAQWQASILQGKLHAQIYPITPTGILPAYQPVKNLLEDQSPNPLKELFEKVFQRVSKIGSLDQLMQEVGLHEYPKTTDQGVYSVPYPGGVRPDYRIGFGTMERDGATGFVISCASCHAGNLFGKTVLGMSNRFPRANDFFVKTKAVTKYYDSWFFKQWTHATSAESALMDSAVWHLQQVSVIEPLALGLDTSLAQVSLSLNHRNNDEYASYSNYYFNFPRKDAFLDDSPADSKPAVWWNLKYKNRWLSDGSVISGNPIFTNIIWNEIGRGSDLKTLETWLSQNANVVNDLTAAVFSVEAPRITDFFPAEKINLASAQHGESLFNQRCAHCHGVYQKAWSLPNAQGLTPEQILRTIKVIPRPITPVLDVGTDVYRRQGMQSLEKLNQLSISKNYGVVIQHQAGYVPPPLVGIWARWPYMHNNSVPSLCQVLTPNAQRVKTYYAGEADSTETDFDFECNGYPLAEKTPANWKQDTFLYDTRRTGMGNTGHDERIFTENGISQLSSQDRKDLIQYLQTL